MTVCFLIDDFGRSGGAQTILRYAAALGDAELVVTAPHAGELPAEAGGVPVRRLAEVAGRSYDCALATWWVTAGALWEVDASRRMVFLQSIESRFYEEHHYYERFGAETVLALPVGYIVVAPWMRDVLAALRPDAACAVVRNGIDKESFAGRSRERSDGPLRILVEGQPSMWFKGVHDALAAVRLMDEPAEVTVVAADPAEGDIDGTPVVGGLDGAGMAAVYAEHDVMLKLSRIESFGLAPLEAFHLGVPAVVAPYTGHEEYLDHGRNGFVVGFDDLPATARALDRIARDRALLDELGAGALATAAAWPSTGDAAAEFARAVDELCDGPPPDVDAALATLQRSERRWLELGREYGRQATTITATLGESVDDYRRDVEHLDRERLAAGEREREAWLQLEEVKASRAYRVARAARRLRPGGRG